MTISHAVAGRNLNNINSLVSLVQMQFGMDPFNNSNYVFCKKDVMNVKFFAGSTTVGDCITRN